MGFSIKIISCNLKEMKQENKMWMGKQTKKKSE